MPVQSVSMNNIAFRGEAIKKDNNNTLALAAKKPAENNRADKKKIALVLGGLAAVGIAAVYIAKGKKVPPEMSIEEFKKIGKFDKGIAKAKGKLFTGTINAPIKDGVTILEYEKGILKQATKFKTTEIPGTTPFLLPNIKKIYSTGEDSTKTVETFLYNINHRTFGGNEWGQIGTTTVSNDKVIVEHINGFTGDKLQDITVKQQDGNWFKTTQEIGKFETGSSYHILTKNAKTGEVIRDELKKVEPAVSSKADTQKDPETLKKQEEVFKL